MSKNSLTGKFEHWSLDRKICAGYGVAFAIAIAGIAAGFLFTQNAERKVLALQAQAMEDVKAISNLKADIIELMLHTRQMQDWDTGNSPEASGFGDGFGHLVEDYAQFKRDWQILQALRDQRQQGSSRPTATAEGGRLVEPLLARHERVVSAYFDQFDPLAQVNPQEIQREQIPAIQAQLEDLDKSQFIMDLEEFLDQITALSDATTAEQAEATRLLEQSVTFQRTVMLASILLSGLFGLVLMRLTSRNLCQPLKEMTQRAQRSIQEADLSLQMPVTSHNEVGVLAAAFNNYSAFIADLVSSHEAVNQQLQTTLEELNQTQLQMIQQEKMSSLGHLVAGVAHELNNPTTFIYSNLAYIQTYADQLLDVLQLYQDEGIQPNPAIESKCQALDLDFIRTDFPKALASMEAGSERICEIVRSLQNFSRSESLETAVIDIHDGLDDAAVILGHRLKAHSDRPAIQLTTQYSPLPLVECYPGLLNQVFFSLISNAIDAIEARIRRHRHCYTVTAPPQITLGTQLEHQWVIVTVEDNGSGITQEVQNHIFDPFFTTKPIGQGTGMGLPISYQIVARRHKGQIGCLATGPQGSTFVVKLPVQSPSHLMNSHAAASQVPGPSATRPMADSAA